MAHGDLESAFNHLLQIRHWQFLVTVGRSAAIPDPGV